MITLPPSLHRTARSLGLMSVGVLSTLGALSFTHVGPAQAQSPGVNLAALVAQVNTLQSKLSADEATINSLKTTVTSQGNTITSLQSSLSGVQSKQMTDEGNIGKLQTLTAPLSLSSDPSAGGTSTLLTISGVNVQIVNGQGGTETANGLGNLIVGYNEKDPQFTQARTGSHNLVVGTGNNYLSYGGLIAGQDNLISATAPYASITGGQFNNARSGHASVTGGSGNTASSSSVSGGKINTASGQTSSVAGGNRNTASGIDSSVSGGNGLSEGSTLGWKAGSESGVPFPTEGNFASD